MINYNPPTTEHLNYIIRKERNTMHDLRKRMNELSKYKRYTEGELWQRCKYQQRINAAYERAIKYINKKRNLTNEEANMTWNEYQTKEWQKLTNIN